MADRRKVVNEMRDDRRKAADRRISMRYDTSGMPVWVTWQEGERRGCGQGRLRDLSLCGASLLTEDSPPVGATLQIRLETSPTTLPVEGAVLRVTKSRRFLGGPFIVSLRFSIPCPYEFFAAAVYNR